MLVSEGVVIGILLNWAYTKKSSASAQYLANCWALAMKNFVYAQFECAA